MRMTHRGYATPHHTAGVECMRCHAHSWPVQCSFSDFAQPTHPSTGTPPRQSMRLGAHAGTSGPTHIQILNYKKHVSFDAPPLHPASAHRCILRMQEDGARPVARLGLVPCQPSRLIVACFPVTLEYFLLNKAYNDGSPPAQWFGSAWAPRHGLLLAWCCTHAGLT